MTTDYEKKYYAALYLRLSQEDGDKVESDSIANQRELGLSFLKNHPEIELVDTFIDDGYSGAHYYNRPDFNRLMEAVKNKQINCVIVKDFSRLGRNFVETGKLIERIFPYFGVRFIALNDNYDSLTPKSTADQLVVPMKNLVNEFIISDTSSKIRHVLANKRQRGEYVAPFAMFGYSKNPENKHQLIVDEFPAHIVEEIFKKILDGYSAEAIAKKLNEQGVPSPLEYKRLMGSKYQTSFRQNSKAKWCAQSVLRILTNPVYTGVLEQGKRSTPNYKVRKQFPVPKEKWAVMENAHEAIISKEMFATVARILKSDMRTAPGQDTVYLFAGLLYCGDCKRSMVRKNNGTKEQPYIYYVCSGNKEHGGCSSHSIRDKKLERAVFIAVKNHIEAVLDIERTLDSIKKLPFTSREVKKANERLEAKHAEIERYKHYKIKLYEDYVDQVVDKEDYQAFAKRYDEKIQEATRAYGELEREIDVLLAGNSEEQQWIEYFKQYKNIKALDRKLVVELIQRIMVFEGKQIEIEFKFQDQFLNATEYISNINQMQMDTSVIKEAI